MRYDTCTPDPRGLRVLAVAAVLVALVLYVIW